MVGVPTDVYLTGAMMFWWIISVAIGVPIAAYVYLPLFQDLGLVSINQVMSEREIFNSRFNYRKLLFLKLSTLNYVFIASFGGYFLELSRLGR